MTHISALSGLRKGLWGVAISKKRTKRDGWRNRQKHSPANETSVGVKAASAGSLWIAEVRFQSAVSSEIYLVFAIHFSSQSSAPGKRPISPSIHYGRRSHGAINRSRSSLRL